jgi:8-oxo-dGTP pyrophosphatase MutT (NUDIX family)
MDEPKRKVLAYITHGSRLLVFRHPHHPDAGIQVPAGTVRDGERPHDAVIREAWEETGLAELILVSFLGEDSRDMAELGLDETHDRYFYHLRCGSNPPETWQHYESDPSDGTPHSILFEFFWADLPDGVPELRGYQGAVLPVLLQHLDCRA